MPLTSRETGSNTVRSTGSAAFAYNEEDAHQGKYQHKSRAAREVFCDIGFLFARRVGAYRSGIFGVHHPTRGRRHVAHRRNRRRDLLDHALGSADSHRKIS